jgi:hypothetical protein
MGARPPLLRLVPHAAGGRRGRALLLGAEALGQPFGAQFLVDVVDAAGGGILAQVMDHVADIVQQRGQHGGRRRVIGFGQCRGLQRMLELVDRAQAVATRGAADEDVQKFLTEWIAHEGIAHAPLLARAGP